VARQTRRLLASAGRLREAGGGGVAWRTTGSAAALERAAGRWLGL